MDRSRFDLFVRHLDVDRASRKVLHGVDFHAEAGRPTLVFGPNGSGKSTLFHTIAGFVSARGGAIELRNRDLLGMPADVRARFGVRCQFQDLRLFETATVRDNLLAALLSPSDRKALTALLARSSLRDAERIAGNRVDALLERLGLAAYANARVAELSFGQRKLVAIARAVAPDPNLLLLDEPLAGLSAPARRVVMEMISEETERVVLIVEHDVAPFRDSGFNAIFLDAGRVEAQGPTGDMLLRRDVAERYLGTSDSEGHETVRLAPIGNPRLAIHGLSAGYGRGRVVSDVSFAVAEGEAVGLIGPNGSGKSTILNAIAGFATQTEGLVMLDGVDLSVLAAHERVHAGVTYLPQRGALFADLTVTENLHLFTAALRAPTPRVVPSPLAERRVQSLSGGERQRAALLRLAIGRPRVMLLDEPSIGLAPSTSRAAGAEIRTVWRSLGSPPLLIAEQNLGFLAELVSRVLVVNHGQIIATLEPKDIVKGATTERFWPWLLDERPTGSA